MTTQEAKFATPAEVLAFMLAGNATFTYRSLRTGTRFTYKVTLADKRNPEDKNEAPAWFVAVLAGPDNTADYTYLGMIKAMTFFATAKSKHMAESASFKTFKWALATFAQNVNVMPSQMEVWHTGHCGRCGRALTVPESVASGIGPECAAIMQREQVKLALDPKAPEIPVKRTYAAAKASHGQVVSTVVTPGSNTEDFNAKWMQHKNEFAAREREQEGKAFMQDMFRDVPELD